MKNILILILISISINANTSTINANYEGGISIFGKVAEANVTLSEDFEKHTYKMKIKAYSIGIVKALTSNREDLFISEGKNENGIYIPYKFTKIVTKTNYLKKTTYIFDYKKEKVLRTIYKEELVEENDYDIIKVKIISKERLVKSNEKQEIKLVPNDYLSMFLNFSKNTLKKGNISYIDQSSSDKVTLINKNEFKVSKHNGEEVYKINVVKDDTILFKKAIAVDIAFYGDAYIEKISKKRDRD